MLEKGEWKTSHREGESQQEAHWTWTNEGASPYHGGNISAYLKPEEQREQPAIGVEFLGVTNSFNESLKRQKELLKEASKGNSLLMNNFSRMNMEDRSKCAKMLGETQFLTGMNADQVVETLGFPKAVLQTNVNPHRKMKFSKNGKLVDWLMQDDQISADLIYECGTKRKNPEMIISIQSFKVTRTSLLGF